MKHTCQTHDLYEDGGQLALVVQANACCDNEMDHDEVAENDLATDAAGRRWGVTCGHCHTFVEADDADLHYLRWGPHNEDDAAEATLLRRAEEREVLR